MKKSPSRLSVNWCEFWNLFRINGQQISDLVLHGGFQPLLLQPVNFDQLYLEQMRRRSEATEAGSA